MKKILTVFVSVFVFVAPASAQDTYTNIQFAGQELNGTARYVGMGGAMEALGADLSTISTNPAGIGMFRKTTVTATGGLSIGNSNTLGTSNAHRMTPTFTQAGFVWVTRTDADSYINLGFNYHMARNFNQLMDVTNSLDNASQNKATYNKYADGLMDVGWASESVLDDLYNRNLMYTRHESGEISDYDQYRNADMYRYREVKSGYISDFEINISANLHNRLYLGFTATMRDVHYQNNSLYNENLLAVDPETGLDITTGPGLGLINVDDETRITGSGFSAKFGAIWRPIAESPFRIGAYVHTPTWYRLTKKISTYLDCTYYPTEEDPLGYQVSDGNNAALEYALTTPWVFGVSLGHTVGNKLALGATYEYSKVNSMCNRVVDGNDYYYYGAYTATSKDQVMNANTRKSLTGTHTFKAGAEYRIIPQLAVRVGYNFVSAMYKKDGVRDASLESQGVWASSTTAYTNWDATHRFTCGLGYTFGKFSADVAWQYSTTSGTFYPFASTEYTGKYAADTNVATPTNVKDNRQTILLSLSYKF